MGQAEVIKFLKKQKQPLTSGEIAKGMNECRFKTSGIIRRLLDSKEILFKEIDRLEALEFHNCKKRCRLYFL